MAPPPLVKEIAMPQQDRYRRLHDGQPLPATDDDPRNPAQHDRDRILYSMAMRRLAGVTQVVAADEAGAFHNRLTHTIEVAQIAGRLAERMLHVTPPEVVDAVGPIDPNVVEAA